MLNLWMSKRPNLGFSIHKVAYLSYLLSILYKCVKTDPIQNQLVLQVHFSNRLNISMLFKVKLKHTTLDTRMHTRYTLVIDV